MINDFLTMIAGGVLAVIVVYAGKHALRKTTGREVPKWVMPAAAGLAMLFVTIWGEYRWFPDARARIGTQMVVMTQNHDSAAYRPWTYLWPVTTRFVALDVATSAKPAPGVVVANLYLVARWQAVQPITVAYDCTNRKQAILGGEAQVNADGSLSAGEWGATETDDAGLKAVCTGG